MRFATRHISRVHLDLSTRCRSYTCNSDAERSLAINLRSCLRRRGPLPLSRLSGLLSPPVMELLEDIPGGLLEFCRQQSNMFVVTSLQNIHVVNAREFLNQVTPEDRDVVAAAVGWLTAAMYFPQRVKISPQPTLHDLLQVLPDCTLTLMELEKCLRRNPDVFKVSARPDCRVSLAAASGTKYEGAGASTTNVLAPTAMFTEGVVSVAPPAPEAKPFELSPTVYHLVLHLCKRGAATHYIPLSHTFPQEGEIFSSFGEEPWWCSTVENFTTAMTSIPEGVFDVRSFCPTRMNRTFVRVLNLPALASLVSDPSSFTMTEEEVQRFQVFTIGERAVAELKAFSLESHVNRLRLTKGLTMTQVSEVLSKELVNDIHRTLSGAEEPFNPEESSNADLLILVFDRLRHIFDVSFSDQTIRVWSLLPPAQQPSSLLWESSPLPLVLFDLLEALAERPRGVSELLHHLHPARRMQLVKLYVNANHAELPEEECAALQQALREFITHHSLYLFLDQTKDGDLVVTPQLAKMQQLCKEPQKNDDARRGSALSGASSSNDDIARRVWDILPANDFLSEKKVRTLFSRNEGTLSETETLRTDFFTRRPHLFQVEEAYCGHIRFIGRAGIRTTPQQQENLKPPIRSLDEVIRAVALSSVKGASAGNIMMELPPQARSMVKRIGSLSDLVEAMPQWFAVQRDALNESSTLITFIGVPSRDIDAAEEGQATPLKKVINHDFSSLTSAATKKADEGWHADWNE